MPRTQTTQTALHNSSAQFPQQVVEALIQFAMTHSLRKMNVRLKKLGTSAAHTLKNYRILHFIHRPKGEADLRDRGVELLPAVRELIGIASGAPVPYDAVLRCLCDRIATTVPTSPTSADVGRFLHICTLAEFLLHTRFVSRGARLAPSPCTLLERRLYKVAVYAMGAARLLSARGGVLEGPPRDLTPVGSFA